MAPTTANVGRLRRGLARPRYPAATRHDAGGLAGIENRMPIAGVRSAVRQPSELVSHPTNAAEADVEVVVVVTRTAPAARGAPERRRFPEVGPAADDVAEP